MFKNMHPRFGRLESAVLEIEQNARLEEREKWSSQIHLMETRLKKSFSSQLEFTARELQIEQEVSRKLEQEVIRLEALNQELHQSCIALKLLQGKDKFFQDCRLGALTNILQMFEFHSTAVAIESKQEILNEALRIACSEDFPDICEVLLRQGADATHRERVHGQNAFHRAVSALGNSDEVLHVLVREGGESVRSRINDVDSSGQTPLSLAVRLLRVDRVLCLLGMGADTGTVTKEDWRRLNDFQVKQEADDSHPHPLVVTVNPPNDTTCESSRFPAKEEHDDSLARHYFQNGHFELALAEFSRLVKSYGTTPPLKLASCLFYASKCCVKLNRHCDAVDFVEKVLSLFPDSREARMQRAESLVALMDYAGAINDLEALGGNSLLLWETREKLRIRSEECYHILDIAENATSLEVRKAFLKQCLKWHPDKNRTNRDDEKRAGFMFKAINDAHLLLMDPHKRKLYDQERALKQPYSPASSFEDDDDDDESDNEEEEFDDDVDEPEEANSTGESSTSSNSQNAPPLDKKSFFDHLRQETRKRTTRG